MSWPTGEALEHPEAALKKAAEVYDKLEKTMRRMQAAYEPLVEEQTTAAVIIEAYKANIEFDAAENEFKTLNKYWSDRERDDFLRLSPVLLRFVWAAARNYHQYLLDVGIPVPKLPRYNAHATEHIRYWEYIKSYGC